MKKTITVLLFIAGIAMTTFGQDINQTYVDKRGKTHLIGQCNRAGLEQDTFPWFKFNYDFYKPNPKLVKKSKRKLKNIEIQIFMGTWCGDSRREVPRFYKVLDALKFDMNKVELVNLSNKKGMYKQSPTGEEKGKFIHRVPTFIVYKEGKEIGRIVESPITSLEMDLAQMLNGLPTAPQYQIVNKVEELLNSKKIPSERKELLEIARAVQHLRQSDSPLNSYGYLMMGREQIDKAIAIFTINAMLYSKVPNVYDSLAEAYEKKGNLKKALNYYERFLKLQPNEKRVQKKVATLKEQIG